MLQILEAKARLRKCGNGRGSSLKENDDPSPSNGKKVRHGTSMTIDAVFLWTGYSCCSVLTAENSSIDGSRRSSSISLYGSLQIRKPYMEVWRSRSPSIGVYGKLQIPCIRYYESILRLCSQVDGSMRIVRSLLYIPSKEHAGVLRSCIPEYWAVYRSIRQCTV